MTAHPQWEAGPRVRVDSLRQGVRFLSHNGATYVYERVDGALKGVHHVARQNYVTGGGAVDVKTTFAGIAEVVVLSDEQS